MQLAIPTRGQWTRALPVAAVVGAVIALDQVTKHLVREGLPIGHSWPEASWPIRITYVENSGSAFGLFAGQTLFLIVASAIAIAVVAYMLRRAGPSSLFLRMSLALVLGGGLSNLADRIRFGGVTDFIDFRVWPIFNVADSSAVIGIALLALALLFRGAKASL